MLDGSWYHPIAGLMILGVIVMLLRGKHATLWLYVTLPLATMIWGVWGVGFDLWALIPCSDILVLFGIQLTLPFVWRRLPMSFAGVVGALVVAPSVSGGMLTWAGFNNLQEVNGTLSANAIPVASIPNVADGNRSACGRNQEGQCSSPLKQINADNVKNLKEAWVSHTGDLKQPNDPGETANGVTLIKVGSTFFPYTAHQRLFALDTAASKEEWHFDPRLSAGPSFQHVICRDVSYHEAKADNAPADVVTDYPCRIILSANSDRLFAVNADSGKLCEAFVNKGIPNLRTNIPVTTLGMYEPISPSIITDKAIVVAGTVTGNFLTRGPSGVIRSFDVNIDRLLWVFDPGTRDPSAIPSDEHHFTLDPPNSRTPAACDAKLNLVYLPMGVTTPDIWGDNRMPERERYASSIVALNTIIGKLAWSHQTVHHDPQDTDIPSQPTLADIEANGKTIPVVYTPAKAGDIFVLDCRDGELVVLAPEKPVPQGVVKEDYIIKTRSFSDLSSRPKEGLTGTGMWGATIFDQLVYRVIFHQIRYEDIFTPPSEQGALVLPGSLEIFKWGGISVDPSHQAATANPMVLLFVSKLIPRGPGSPVEPPRNVKGSSIESGVQPQYGVPYGITLNPFLLPFSLPCRQPTWDYISALDLKTDGMVQKKRIGTSQDNLPFPMPAKLPFTMGMSMLGGPVSIADNTPFIGATVNSYLHTYNMSNGEKLRETRLPADDQAVPMTCGVDGKQYVVISAGGHDSFGTKMGDYIVAYVLPNDTE